MKLHSYIRDNELLYSLFWKVANRLPGAWVYPREYYDVYNLLSSYDGGENIDSHLQNRLAGILRTALRSVPYYRELKIGVKPEDITAATAKQALMEFPYLEKCTVMENPEAFISDRYKINKLMIDTSGGSTGEGVKIYTNARQKFIELAFNFYEWEKAGWKPTSRVVRMGADAVRKNNENPFSRKGDKLLISPFYLKEELLPAIYDRITAYKTEYFHSYPSCIFQLTRYLYENRLHIPSIKGVFLYSEEVTPAMIDVIKEVFKDVPVLINYGLSERSNFAWSNYHNGELTYRLVPVYGWSENRYDPNGYPEIVGTTYWNDIMPFIRYRTQDYGLIENGTIRKIEGRAQSFLITRDGRKVPGTPIDIDKQYWEHVDSLHIVQNELGQLEFHIVPRSKFSSDIENKILMSSRKKWGDLFDINTVLTESKFQTASGKQMMIVSKLINRFDVNSE
jgi:phenylacetate-CoA ligase